MMKAGEIVRIRSRMQAMGVMKLYAEQFGYDLALCERAMPGFPEALVCSVHSLVYASRVFGIKQLLELVDLLKDTYGKKWVELAASDSSKAPDDFKALVMFHTPSP
jgi:hypothetical protein